MDLHARAGVRTVVSACASSTEAIANAYEHLQAGLADVVIAGGSEAAIHPLPIAAFAAMQALSRRNDDPADGIAPLRRQPRRLRARRGRGRARRSRPRSTPAPAAPASTPSSLGGAVTSDAYHITAPDPEGSAAARAMLAALEQAGASLARRRAHQRARDEHARRRHRRVQRAASRLRRPPRRASRSSATKASTGHLLGGAGALEAIFTILALHERTAPPTINLTEQDPAIPLDVVTSPRALGDGDLARDQQLVRLRRPQRRRRVPHASDPPRRHAPSPRMRRPRSL